MDELMGTIKLFAGNFVPRGYLECNGAELPVVQYQALFAIVGNAFGGDGRKGTFALPKLSAPAGRYIICVEGIFPVRD